MEQVNTETKKPVSLWRWLAYAGYGVLGAFAIGSIVVLPLTYAYGLKRVAYPHLTTFLVSYVVATVLVGVFVWRVKGERVLLPFVLILLSLVSIVTSATMYDDALGQMSVWKGSCDFVGPASRDQRIGILVRCTDQNVEVYDREVLYQSIGKAPPHITCERFMSGRWRCAAK